MGSLIFSTSVIVLLIVVVVRGVYLDKKREKENSKCCVEFHVLPKRYYPVYKNKYMRRDYGTQLIHPLGRHFVAYASYFSSEEEAKAMIEEYKEQLKNETMVEIEV